MGIKKTLGGDRLHSGKKMKVELKAYERSTHNLSKNWKSSMAPGTLVPFYWNIALNGDTWDIDLNALIKTKPTIAPLFGMFKMQLDMFTIPIRLYNGLLHNNATAIGMKMNQVLLPKLRLATTEPKQFNPSSLLSYLGLKGICSKATELTPGVERTFNAIPVLAYMDIFKQYYSNKQETNAYQITAVKTITKKPYITLITCDTPYWERTFDNKDEEQYNIANIINNNSTITIEGEYLNPQHINIYVETEEGEPLYNEDIVSIKNEGRGEILSNTDTLIQFNLNELSPSQNNILMYINLTSQGETINTGEIVLSQFPLSNIDDMRYDILRNTGLNKTITIGDVNDTKPPYSNINHDNALLPQNGLLMKTYKSDLFNNWLSSEWIEGINGISKLTSVSTSSGNFTMDALNLAQKVYNMFNLIAASGGTYEDWQEAKWGDEKIRRAENPIYEGGASYHIGFEEVTSTADTQTESAGDQPLGTLAGKGTTFDKKGGHIVIKVDEPSIIMGIASITPEIAYSQGNKWQLTEIKTLEDLHSPELDGIGFQDLIAEQMAWWTTSGDEAGVITKQAVGKQPAWIHWMTDVDEIHGDFAEPDKAGFMVLDRAYTRAEDNTIEDQTTYIDPTKFNGAFAETSLDAQNFWVQIAMNITCRRKMSAKLIPYL